MLQFPFLRPVLCVATATFDRTGSGVEIPPRENSSSTTALSTINSMERFDTHIVPASEGYSGSSSFEDDYLATCLEISRHDY